MIATEKKGQGSEDGERGGAHVAKGRASGSNPNLGPEQANVEFHWE